MRKLIMHWTIALLFTGPMFLLGGSEVSVNAKIAGLAAYSLLLAYLVRNNPETE